MASTGNSMVFGDLSAAIQNGAGMASPVRGVFAGGYDPSGSTDRTEYITISTGGRAVDFGNATYHTPSGMWGASNADGGL